MRSQIRWAAALLAAVAVVPVFGQAYAAPQVGAKTQPNLLVIITDQQSSDAMSCAIGNEYLDTPAMDSLAAAGMRFRRAYCANPLCMPSRTSMFSGHYPHETGVQTNDGGRLDPNRFVCMGRVFRDAGYDTGFFGKWHMAFPAANVDEHGFATYEGRKALYDGTFAAEFIVKRRNRPFLAVASFMNPHNICEWSRGQRLPGVDIGEPPAPEQCPPLQPNMDPPQNETDIMSHMRRAYQAHRLFPVGDFQPDKWRAYAWAYYRLVESVDRKIGIVLNALRSSGQEENTVIVFLADHGECRGVHRWNQKTVFYDESAQVPLVISQKGHTPAGVCETLAHTGVDLLPTLCDFAGVEPPPGLPGESLKACALGQTKTLDRSFVVSENCMVQCEPVDGVLLKPDGRMVRSDRYKYCLYSLGQRRESLVDIQNDPRRDGQLGRRARDARRAHCAPRHVA